MDDYDRRQLERMLHELRRRQLERMLHELRRRPRSPAQLVDRLLGLRDAMQAPPWRGMASRSGLDPFDEHLATLESLSQVPPDRWRAEEELYERLLSEALSSLRGVVEAALEPVN